MSEWSEKCPDDQKSVKSVLLIWNCLGEQGDLKSVRWIQKVSKGSEKSTNNVKSRKMIWKVTTQSESCLNDPKSVAMIWKVFTVQMI